MIFPNFFIVAKNFLKVLYLCTNDIFYQSTSGTDIIRRVVTKITTEYKVYKNLK